jgi:hypothetical protein
MKKIIFSKLQSVEWYIFSQIKILYEDFHHATVNFYRLITNYKYNVFYN